MKRKHYIIVIPASIVDEINAWIETNWPDAGPNNFSVGLNTEGDAKKPQTHVWAGWYLTGVRKVELDAAIAKLGAQYSIDDSKVKTKELIFAAYGVKVREYSETKVAVK